MRQSMIIKIVKKGGMEWKNDFLAYCRIQLLARPSFNIVATIKNEGIYYEGEIIVIYDNGFSYFFWDINPHSFTIFSTGPTILWFLSLLHQFIFQSAFSISALFGKQLL